MTDFAVIDVETTGLYPGRSDRIIEIGVIRINSKLELVEQWETLVNPERDIGPTHIHGISSSQVINAPTFSDIAGDLAVLLNGAITIGHNASFDIRFLANEYRRLGIELEPWKHVCTMSLARNYGLGNSLTDCCERLEIEYDTSHRALSDAVATACLFGMLLQADAIELPSPLHCPDLSELTKSGLCLSRENAMTSYTGVKIDSVIQNADPSDHDFDLNSTEAMQYLDRLDKALEDRLVTNEEKQELKAFASQCGLKDADLSCLHLTYLKSIIAYYQRDGVLSEDEHRDLDRVSQLLGIQNWEQVEEAKTLLKLNADEVSGMRVCFTGETSCTYQGKKISKSVAIELAESLGMTVAPGVSKKVDLLVVADADTQSGKAKKARSYGIRLVKDRAFWHRLGISVD